MVIGRLHAPSLPLLSGTFAFAKVPLPFPVRPS
jgi:hypothetical protein